MSFLKDYLPAPVVDIGLPLLLLVIVVFVVVPRVITKLKATGAWDNLIDRVGGEKYRLLRFEREIAGLTKAGDYVGAARLYEEAEWYPEAINMYVEAEDYNSAGIIYERLEQWEQAAEMFKQADDWKRACSMLAKVGKHAQAAAMFEQHGQKIDAAKLYFDAGQYQKAAVLYQEVAYFPQAGKAFEKLGDYIHAAENYEEHWTATTSVGGGGLIASPSDREARIALHAGKLFEKGGAPERAKALYKRAGIAKQAAELAARMGEFDEAAEMLLKEEDLEKAAQMFRKAGNEGRANLLEGELAFQHGDNATAAEKFLKGGDNLRAAELYESVGDLTAAASCYEQSDAPLQAANVYLRAGEKSKAAEMFERGHDFEMAAKLYEEIGDKDNASQLYERSGQFYEAGKLASSLGNSDRAIHLLQQLDTTHEGYADAIVILSRLFIEKDMPGLAIDKLERLLKSQQIGAKNLEHFYTLGRAYESQDNKEAAVSTYRKIMAERYGYEDVEQRITRLSSPGQAPAPAPAAVSSSGSSSSASTGVAPEAAVPASIAPSAATAAAAASPPPPAASVSSGASPSAPPHSKSPIQLGEKLGEGLLGTTYKGLDTRSETPVIIKILRAELLKEKTVVQRFLAEAKLARSLAHPSLVRLFGLVEIDGAKAVVTEYVEGFDLGSFLARTKTISLKQALDLLNTLSAALGHAHERKLVHRNVKASNVLLGTGGKIRLSGFGFGALRLPQLGRADGYPSPELLQGAAVDHRSDIYSLGALLFHALSGQHPESEQFLANGTPPHVRQVRPELPEALDEILARCLAKEPSARFGSTAEIAGLTSSIPA